MPPLLFIHPPRNSIPINDDVVIRAVREKKRISIEIEISWWQNGEDEERNERCFSGTIGISRRSTMNRIQPLDPSRVINDCLERIKSEFDSQGSLRCPSDKRSGAWALIFVKIAVESLVYRFTLDIPQHFWLRTPSVLAPCRLSATDSLMNWNSISRQ